MTELIAAGISIAIIGFTFLLGWLLAKISGAVWDIKAKKHRAKYPTLYELYKMRDKLYHENHNIWKAQYHNPKQEIDDIMKNMRYFTKAKREEKYVELEQLRETIANYFAVIRPIEEEIDRIDQQIEDYKKLHKIKKVY
jgi:Mg2+ and Co2+ transporter CorA